MLYVVALCGTVMFGRQVEARFVELRLDVARQASCVGLRSRKFWCCKAVQGFAGKASLVLLWLWWDALRRVMARYGLAVVVRTVMVGFVGLRWGEASFVLAGEQWLGESSYGAVMRGMAGKVRSGRLRKG